MYHQLSRTPEMRPSSNSAPGQYLICLWVHYTLGVKHKRVLAPLVHSKEFNRSVLISERWNRGVPLYTEVSSFQEVGVPLYTEVSSFQGVGIEEFHYIQRLRFRVLE